MIRESIVEFLDDNGYEAVGAADGQEALEKLARRSEPPPCLILLDLMMPVMDGQTFRERAAADAASWPRFRSWCSRPTATSPNGRRGCTRRPPDEAAEAPRPSAEGAASTARTRASTADRPDSAGCLTTGRRRRLLAASLREVRLGGQAGERLGDADRARLQGRHLAGARGRPRRCRRRRWPDRRTCTGG